ncbi:MAG: DUF29 domain-containing protein [Bryobacteraceae bacterium]|jgi:SpoVK/Ycf46/Vps4 family AAA+-type ATPase
MLLYDTDFYEWTAQSAELLRQHRLQDLDLEHLAEEIEALGKRDRWEVHNRLRVLIMHLLRWQIQPERRENSTWRATIDTQRDDLEPIFEQSPSLRRYAAEDLSKICRKAARQAVREAGNPPSELPDECPFTMDQILDEDFLP